MYEHAYSVKVMYCIQVKQKIDTVRIHIFSWRAREKHDRLTGMKSKSIDFDYKESTVFQISLVSLC